MNGHIALIGDNEFTTSIPGHTHLGRWWDYNTRGLGPTLTKPITSAGDDNQRCVKNRLVFVCYLNIIVWNYVTRIQVSIES